MKSTFTLVVLFVILLSFPVMRSFAQDIPFEVEPNDTREQAQECWYVSGEIGVDGDVEDWYKVSGLDPEEYVSFNLVYDTELQRIDFEVYSDTNVIATTVFAESNSIVSTLVPGQCYVRVLATNGQGVYQLYADQAYDFCGMPTYVASEGCSFF